MKKHNQTFYTIAVFFILLLAAVLLFLSLYVPAVLCAALSFVPLVFALREKQAALDEAGKTAENYAKALEAQEVDHAQELQRAKAASLEELEDFRSVLSHQLRMPLSIVQGYADILIKGLVSDEDAKREYLQKIVDRTQYISELLSNQLSIHRNVDEIKPVFDEIDLISLLRRAAEDMQTVAKNQGIEIQSISAVDSLIIEADAHQLNKVVFNIIENSLKYMGREGRVNIVTEQLGKNAVITIKDDGLGLDSEETSHIFELSYQGSNKITGHGHGHGLYLAQRATEAHGGTISATSSPGMGMAIKITLPLRQSAQAEVTAEQ